MRSTNISSNGISILLGKKLLRLWQGKKKKPFPWESGPCTNLSPGFTVLEVMVALAIVGISIGIFFSLIGNSSRLRDKIDRHTRLLFLARNKAEESFLGILGKKYVKLDEKKTFEGTTIDGIQWKVTETDTYKETKKKIDTTSLDLDEENTIELPPKGTTLLSTQVEGISLETIFFPQESEEESSLDDDKDIRDNDTDEEDEDEE